MAVKYVYFFGDGKGTAGVEILAYGTAISRNVVGD